MFSSLIENPKMTEKLLSKPPFKYIYDIIIETCKKTNFAQGSFDFKFSGLYNAQ
jgi:TRAF3-interacting protein 1